MTGAASTFDQVSEYIRAAYEMPDLALTPETKLVELENLDPEEFQFLLSGIERSFAIRHPRIVKLWPYMRALWRWNGVFELGTLVRLVDRRAVLKICDDMTIAELCAVVDAGNWPTEMVVPPDAIDEGLASNQ